MDYLFPSFLSCKRYLMGKLEQSSKYRGNQRLQLFYMLIYLFLCHVISTGRVYKISDNSAIPRIPQK